MAGIDRFRMLAAALVVAIHTSPLAGYSDTADFILTRVIARVAVPFFFMTTGYFVLAGGDGRIRRFLKKSLALYGISILLYIPLNIYAGHFDGIIPFIKAALIEGTMYHLWYFPAVITGVLLLWQPIKRWPMAATATAAAALYAVGLMGDSYYGLAAGLPGIKGVLDGIFSISAYTRNGLFYAPVFLLMGYCMSKRQPLDRRVAIGGVAVSMAIMLAEALWLRSMNAQRHDSMYIALLPCMFFLYSALLNTGGKGSKKKRDMSMLIYVIHPWMIVAVRGAAKAMGMEAILVDNSLAHFIAVAVASFACARAVYALTGRRRQSAAQPAHSGRAWVEVNTAHLLYNARALQRILPQGCRLMPAVKADAYGHGAVLVGQTLNSAGISDFCVATLDEAIELRDGGVKGDILILGYTPPSRAGLLERYSCIQTVVDANHAGQLARQQRAAGGKRLRVHIKVDTGMHRLGEQSISAMAEMFGMGLRIEGMFTHLCRCDSAAEGDIAFTKQQINAFMHAVDELRAMGCEPGKLHVQSSYGVFNYPGVWDYARVGLALYGVVDERGAFRDIPALRPVLSVKAGIAAVKDIAAGEGVGYGHAYTAERDMRIALLTIGYADGIPRSIAKGHVLIGGRQAPIVGRICMDQMAVDISGLDVQAGDTAILLGADAAEAIDAVQMADWAGSIPNELLSCLGRRLARVWSGESLPAAANNTPRFHPVR